MRSTVINNIQVRVCGDNISDNDLLLYLTSLQAKEKHKIVIADVSVNTIGVDVNYKLEYVPFERIRRSTGYLVGATAKWCEGTQTMDQREITH